MCHLEAGHLSGVYLFFLKWDISMIILVKNDKVAYTAYLYSKDGAVPSK